VSRRKVRFTATARRQVRILKQWWRENRAYPEIPDQDLAKALDLLAGFPQIGSPYPNPKVNQVRRFYLERLTSHLYYTFDEEQLIIRALWHARRGTGPDLGSV